MTNGAGRIAQAAGYLKQRLGEFQPDTAIVLGSGLGHLAETAIDADVIPYGDIPDFPLPTVVGHSGNLVAGKLGGRDVIMQSGRFHLYEGHEPETVVLPVRVFAQLGVQNIIVTNAAGGINRSMKPPTLMLINDHINLMWKSPLRGAVVDGETRFPDMSAPYNEELLSIARQVALDEGIHLSEGVYVGLLGPSYETPAEIRMLDRLGGDAVGMSTVPEAIVANSRGMKVLGISSITNPAAGTTNQALDHEEVLEAGIAMASDLGRIVTGVLSRL